MQSTCSQPSPRTRISRGLVLLVLGMTAGSAAAMDITSCGQTIAPHDKRSLVVDLDCPWAIAVTVGHRGTLFLNGHVIVGEIICAGSCTVTGPGDVSQGSAGLFVENQFAPHGAVVRVSQVTFHDNIDGIGDGARRLIVRDVVASHNTNRGFNWAIGSIRGRNVTTNDNGTGGIFAQGTVESPARVRLRNCTATGNGGAGVAGGRVSVADSVITGNGGTDPLDLISTRRPRLVRTTCDHSLGPDGTWGVCAND